MFHVTRNKNMYGLGVGISTVFEIAEHFLFNGGAEPPHMVMTYIPSDVPWHDKQEYHQMFLDIRNKNVYSLGVGILTVFNIFRFSAILTSWGDGV
jgi:hypothetical protein